MNKSIKTIFAILLLSGIIVILIFEKKIIDNQKNNSNLILATQEKLEEHNEKIGSLLKDLHEKLENQIATLGIEIMTEYEKEIILIEEIDEQLDGIQNEQFRQIKQTTNMASKYDQILEAEKNRKIINSERDNELENKKKQIKELYKKQDYLGCIKCCSEVLVYEPEDYETRFYKMISTFTLNKMDSSKYEEILEDCSVLKKVGYRLDTVNTIEAYIQAETSGVKNEE